MTSATATSLSDALLRRGRPVLVAATLPVGLFFVRNCTAVIWRPPDQPWPVESFFSIGLLVIWAVCWMAVFPGFAEYSFAARRLSRIASSWLVVSLGMVSAVTACALLWGATLIRNPDAIDWLTFPLYLGAVEFVLSWGCVLLGIALRAGWPATIVSFAVTISAYSMAVFFWFAAIAAV